MKTNKIILMLCGLFPAFEVKAQEENRQEKKELVYHLNESGSRYVRLGFLNQTWLRYNQSNPGTTVDGTPKGATYDIGLRRTRIQFFGQLSGRLFFYTQLGLNNFTYHSSRKQGIFFHDVLSEYKVAGKFVSLGAGLTGWSGLSRYASPSVGSILTLDAPLYQQATNDVNDQFLRKLSIYAKGKIGKLDYRVAVTNPMSLAASSAQQEVISENSLFSNQPPKAQLQGYFMFQFLDKEANTTPYNAGTYLGKKRVFNIGAGFITQQHAMWRLENNTDTVMSNMGLFAMDVFYDAPLNAEKENAITAYACFSYSNYGQNYIRNIGVMNPANGMDVNATLNGTGNGAPIIGTGNTLYGQVGYLFKKDLLGKAGTLQPFAACQYSDMQLLKDPMLLYEGGVNWLMEGHRSKISLNYQSRPVFSQDLNGNYINSSRRGMLVMQLQVSL